MEQRVWSFVSSLLKKKDLLREGLEQMIENERDGACRDPEREAKAWLDKLTEADRKRSGFQDMAAEGLITFDELRTKLADLEETHEAVQQKLAALGGHQAHSRDFE